MSDPTIPMWNRTSDVRNLVLNGGCDLDTILNWLYPERAPGLVWWVLGSALHKGIELTILLNLSYDQGLYECHLEKQVLLHENRKVGTRVSTSNRAKRGLDTLDADIDRMFLKWWKAVHPDSDERLHWYEDYDWPPKVEYMISVPDAPGAELHTEVDAIFTGGPEHKPVAIVDWKSGSSKSAAPAQLHIYRYGLHREGGWFPNGTGPAVGWFHHLDHDKIQIVEPYIGDTAVAHWLTMTAAYKEALKENNTVVAAPDWWCNYCNVKDLCPISTDDPEQAISWVEILGRLERAEPLPSPEVKKEEK